MEDFKEITLNSESIINLLLANGGREFTNKVKKNDDYDIVSSYMYATKFKQVIDYNLVTSFALRPYENKTTHIQFLRYKIVIRIPTPDGVRYIENDFGVGYNSKEAFSKIRGKVDTNHLPLEWLKHLRIDIKRKKSDGKEFTNAELINIDRLMSSI